MIDKITVDALVVSSLFLITLSYHPISAKGTTMERTTTVGGSYTGGGNSPNLANPKIEDATQAAHQATDKVADKATAQVGRLSATAHRAIDGAGSAASTAADWASAIPEQAMQMQAEFVESASASIRARPLATVAGALVIGYLVGRLARW